MGRQKNKAGTFVRLALVQFRQDVGDFRRCIIFDTAGNKRAAEPQECVGLERAAVWEQDSVEERLLDAFLGRPNAAEEHLKVRLRWSAEPTAPSTAQEVTDSEAAIDVGGLYQQPKEATPSCSALTPGTLDTEP